MAHAVSRDRRRYTTPSTTGRFLAVLGIVFSGAVFLYIAVTLVIVPGLRISRVSVQADFTLDRGEIMTMAGLRGDETFLTFRPDMVEARLEEHYLIQSATVEKVFPNQAKITLTRRRPLATVAYTDPSAGTVLGLVDREGVLFALPARAEGTGDTPLPVLSGIVFDEFRRGMKLPPMVRNYLEQVDRLRLESPELFRLFSEIEVLPVAAGGFDVRLYLRSFPVPVLTESRIDRELCSYIVMVLDALTRSGMTRNMEEIDFRSGEIVYRLKEEEVVE